MSISLEIAQQELAELRTKRTDLSKLLKGAQPVFISDLQWSLLQAQLVAMDTYSKLLTIRIEYWEV